MFHLGSLKEIMRLHYRSTKMFLRITVLLFLLCCNIYGQEGIVTVGFQVKPIFSSKFFNTGPVEGSIGTFNAKVTPQSGYCAGMVIRRGLTQKLSIETGINYVRRNYVLDITDTNYAATNRFKFIGYELPVSALVYIRLGEKLFMDASLGGSFDFFPSDIDSEGSNHYQVGRRKRWANLAVISNLGVEWRTENAGYFYLGASYHRPFEFIFASLSQLKTMNVDTFVRNDLSGNYLTIDIRYFFHEEPLRKQRKKGAGEE